MRLITPSNLDSWYPSASWNVVHKRIVHRYEHAFIRSYSTFFGCLLIIKGIKTTKPKGPEVASIIKLMSLCDVNQACVGSSLIGLRGDSGIGSITRFSTLMKELSLTSWNMKKFCHRFPHQNFICTVAVITISCPLICLFLKTWIPACSETVSLIPWSSSATV